MLGGEQLPFLLVAIRLDGWQVRSYSDGQVSQTDPDLYAVNTEAANAS